MSEFREYTIDFVSGLPDQRKQKEFNIDCYPNPFLEKTSFIIDCDNLPDIRNAYIKIHDITGKVQSVIPITGTPDINNQIKIEWVNTNKISDGIYNYSLYHLNEVIATGKMIISN